MSIESTFSALYRAVKALEGIETQLRRIHDLLGSANGNTREIADQLDSLPRTRAAWRQRP